MSELGSPVVRIADTPCWVAPTPDRRRFCVLVDPQLTGSLDLAAGTLVLPPGQEQTSSSSHPSTEEIYYVIRGRGEIELSGARFPIASGDLVYIPPNTDHRVINTDSSTELEFLFANTPALSDYKPVLEGWELLHPAARGE